FGPLGKIVISERGTQSKRTQSLRSALRPDARKRNALFAEAFGNLSPIDHVPPRVEVVGALVLILEIVGMFPDVDTQDRLLVLHGGSVLVRCAGDGQLAVVIDQPGPTAAEAANTRSLELGLEGGKVAEG